MTNQVTLTEDEQDLLTYCRDLNLTMPKLVSIEMLFRRKSTAQFITTKKNPKVIIGHDLTLGKPRSRIDTLCNSKGLQFSFVADSLGISIQQLLNIRNQTAKIDYYPKNNKGSVISLATFFNVPETAILGHIALKDIKDLQYTQDNVPLFKFNEETQGYNPWHHYLQAYDTDFDYYLEDMVYFDTLGAPARWQTQEELNNFQPLTDKELEECIKVS